MLKLIANNGDWGGFFVFGVENGMAGRNEYIIDIDCCILCKLLIQLSFGQSFKFIYISA